MRVFSPFREPLFAPAQGRFVLKALNHHQSRREARAQSRRIGEPDRASARSDRNATPSRGGLEPCEF
ncbi:hypothetical protein DBR41_11140, partial [Pseudomonas sp. HMWF010]